MTICRIGADGAYGQWQTVLNVRTAGGECTLSAVRVRRTMAAKVNAERRAEVVRVGLTCRKRRGRQRTTDIIGWWWCMNTVILNWILNLTSGAHGETKWCVTDGLVEDQDTLQRSACVGVKQSLMQVDQQGWCCLWWTPIKYSLKVKSQLKISPGDAISHDKFDEYVNNVMGSEQNNVEVC